MRALPLLLFLAAPPVAAQQLAQYTQYVFNMFSVNPAVAGSKECLDLRLGFRQQWVGFEGAPVTGWASMHGTLRGKKRGHLKHFHAVGGLVEADNAGNWGYTRLLLAYAYNMQMNQDARLAFGVFAGGIQEKLNVGDITLAQYDDPILGQRASVMVLPEVTPGLWYYDKRNFLGLSMHQVVGNRIKGIGEDSRLARHFMLSGGRKFKVGKKTSLTPSTLIKKAGAAPFALDLNAIAEWNRTIALGAGYRNGDAITLQMRVSFAKFFQLGYSYDITTSPLAQASSNTHEIILGITPCGGDDAAKRTISCPAFE